MKINELGKRWRIAYQRLLENDQFVEALAVPRYYQPEKIYKYFSFNEYWRDTISQG